VIVDRRQTSIVQLLELGIILGFSLYNHNDFCTGLECVPVTVRLIVGYPWCTKYYCMLIAALIANVDTHRKLISWKNTGGTSGRSHDRPCLIHYPFLLQSYRSLLGVYKFILSMMNKHYRSADNTCAKKYCSDEPQKPTHATIEITQRLPPLIRVLLRGYQSSTA